MEEQDDREFEKIKHVIDSARREVNRQNPDLALKYLLSIKFPVECYPNTLPWAEFPLVSGEACLAKRDPAAGGLLRESLERLANLPNGDLGLALRAHKGYGRFLARSADTWSAASQQYEKARGLAIKAGLKEESAEVALMLIMTDLRRKGSPLFESFMTLKKAADGHYTYQEQLAAWYQHLGVVEEAGQGRKAARLENRPNEHYFRNVLESVRETQNEEEIEK